MEKTLTNDRLIAHHRNKLDYVESPPNTLQFSYGESRYVKMTYQLYHESDILKKKTLEELNEDFRRSDFTNLMILSSDLTSVIVKHFTHQNVEIRELASRAMIEICNTDLGRKLIMDSANIHDIILLIDDANPQIRQNVYQSLLNLTEFVEGQDHFLLSDALQNLVDKLVEEKEENILIMVLQLIKTVLEGEGGTEQILQTQAIKRLTNLLDNKNEQIRRLAALNLAQISFLDIGKIAEIDQKCVLELCKRIDDHQSSVREAATIALASLAQKNEAKNQILDYDYFAKIMKLLNDDSEQTKLNVIQLISSVSEHPLGRLKAQTCLDSLKGMLAQQEHQYLHQYIQSTIEVITWKP